MTIVEFLLDRIEEDAAVARAATPGPWSVDNPSYPESIRSGDYYTPVVVSRFDRDADAHHIARHDPARVLAECEAKRRIVGLHESRPDWPDCQECGDRDDTKPWPCSTLRLLALPYADHPDYRPEWRTRAPEYQD